MPTNETKKITISNPASNKVHGPYPSNKITSTKYTPFNFIFKNLFFQFQKLANVYFLLAGCLEVIPFFTITDGVPTYLFPLVFILSVTAVKDLLEDLSRRKSDAQENGRKVLVYDGVTQQKFVTKTWKQVVVGDLVQLKNREMIPADMIMIASSTKGGLVYVSTANLDGETNLKLRKVHPELNIVKEKSTTTQSSSDSEDEEETTLEDGCRALRDSVVDCEQPNKFLQTFKGALTFSQHWFSSPFYSGTNLKISMGRENILLRSCQIRNTNMVIGIVVSTGVDTKIQQNIAEAPFKTSRLMKDTNKLVGTAFFAMVVVCLICAIMSYGYHATIASAGYLYAKDANNNHVVEELEDGAAPISLEVQTIFNFFTFIIIFGNFVPISLYVTLDIVKFLQSQFMMWDNDIYDPATKTYTQVKSLDLNEELGSVDHVFSDKTGTLTCNTMEFMKCSVGGQLYGLGITEVGKNVLLRAGQAIPMVPPRPKGDPITANVNFVDPSLWQVLKQDGNGKNGHFLKVQEFCYHLALNHNVAPERTNINGRLDIVYSASSPDENALVSAARHFGYFFYKRSTQTATIQNIRQNTDFEFQVLNVLKFTSKRKRSSVIVRRPNNTLVLYCKGADNVILERLKAPTTKEEEQVIANSKKHTTQFAADGLRTLMISMKNISEDDYQTWHQKYMQASLGLKNRQLEIENVCEEMEQDLILMGVTGIEDRLQEGVSDTIACLRAANIKVWVLTGDKVDTAVNIGYACALLTTKMNLMYLTADEKGEMLKNTPKGELESVKALTVNKVKKRLTVLLKTIQKAIKEQKEEASTNNNTLRSDGRALIVDTYVLSLIESGGLEDLFLQIASTCASVVCARVSPSQKSTVVQCVRAANPNLITLAIGDGANDVPMIQTAHIGIGISGQEGLQAVNSSDYAIAQFRFLKKLLLVHGRWSARRVAFVINYIFYKNIFAVIPAFVFGFYNAMSGRLLFNVWMQQTFNLVTFVPIAVYGVLDRDVEANTAMQFPELYSETKHGLFFSVPISGWWLVLSFIHAVVSYFIPYITYSMGVDQVLFGSAVQFLVVLMVNVQLLVHARYITTLLVGAIVFSLLVHVTFIWGLSEFSYYFIDDLEYEHVFMNILGSAEMWLAMVLGSGVVVVISLVYQHLRTVCCPRPFHICPELERGHFVPSLRYPTRASLRVEAGVAAMSGAGSGAGGPTLLSSVKIKPTKSSIALTDDKALLKRYLIGLYLEYGTTAGMEEATPQMKSTVLLQMLQHCAPSQSNTALPNTVLNLTQQDMIDFIVERGDGVAAPTTADRDETLFRQNTSGAPEYYLKQKSWNKFTKKLVQRPEQPPAAGLSKGHLACVHLVLRSHLLLNTRKKELGYIFDAYDVDGNGSMSSNELSILLSDIARNTATANGNGSGSASDGNPQADDDDGMETVQGRGQNSSTNNSSQMTSDDLNMFIASMDSNGDGKLGKDEWIDYCMRGMNMGNKQRQAFSRRSAMHAKLQLFITNILKRIEETTR